MSKASAAIRRSGVRLRSLGSGHGQLNLVISEQSSTRQRYKDLLTSQTESARKLEKWSQAEENPAIQDVLHQVYELNLMWIEAQREFVVALKEYKRVYETILEQEKKLDQAKKTLASCEEKERKLQKEMLKGPKEPAVTQEKLRQMTQAKELADIEVAGQQKETEAIKLMTIRAGLLDMSRSWDLMGKKCSLIAQSQQELAQLIPDIGAVRVQDLPSYGGSRDSSRILYSARTQLEQLGPPDYGRELSYDPAPPSYNSIRPSSATINDRRGSSKSASGLQRRSSEPTSTTLTTRNLQVLDSIEQEGYDSFDSFESD